MVEVDQMKAWHEAVRNNPALLDEIKKQRGEWNAQRASTVGEEAQKLEAWQLFKSLARIVFDALPGATAEGWSRLEDETAFALKGRLNSDSPAVNSYVEMYRLVRLAYFGAEDMRKQNLPLEHELSDLKTIVEHYFRTHF
jgi:hypothetical protein